MTNRMGDLLVDGIKDIMNSTQCEITHLTLKGLRNEDCPSMQTDKKRPCRMSRDSLLVKLVDTFSSCPLTFLSVESNLFAATTLIDLEQKIIDGLFPDLKSLNIDGRFILLLIAN